MPPPSDSRTPSHLEVEGVGRVELRMVSSDASLAAAIQACADVEAVGIDTEFFRERTYFPIAGLIQLACRDTVYLIDPLKIEDFAPLGALLTDSSVRKVIHAAGEDLQVLDVVTGSRMRGLFDTQTAVPFTGGANSPGFHKIVQSVFSISLPKEETRSDWLARPLTTRQIIYASLDAAYLVPLYTHLREQLIYRDRLEWVEADNESTLAAHSVALEPDRAWRRIKGIDRLDANAQHRLVALATWRETTARSANLPRGHVIADRLLTDVAKRAAMSSGDLAKLDGLHPRSARKFGQAMVECHRTVCAALKRTKPALLAARPDSARATVMMPALKVAVEQASADFQLPVEILATKRNLEALLIAQQRTAEEPDANAAWYVGWRKELLTPYFEPVLRGNEST
jgi:ribonuclease D